MKQIHAIAGAGGDLVRCAVPRDEDVRLAGELADLERVLAVVRELAVAGARPS